MIRRPTDAPPQATPVLLADYEEYESAQAAVDRLSDEGFPVEQVSIVWNRLRQIEYVTGRATTWTAAGRGAVTGVWFGTFIGLVLALFVDLEDGVNVIGVVASYALTGAIVVAAFMAAQHWLQRGRRDFSTVGTLRAESYEVWVQPEFLPRARTILDIGDSGRSMEPDAREQTDRETGPT